jgi:hypothetical protein
MMKIRVKDTRTVSIWNSETQRWECYKPIVENGCLIGIRYHEETREWPDDLDVVYNVLYPAIEDFEQYGFEVYPLSAIELAIAWMQIVNLVERD